MSQPRAPDTDAFLLNLDEQDFVRVGAMLGLRARPATSRDVALVDQFLDGDFLLSGRRTSLLVTAVASRRPH